jgi:hypothetical protein
VAACGLYRSLGFVEVAPYTHNPFDDVLYLGLDLGGELGGVAPAGRSPVA